MSADISCLCDKLDGGIAGRGGVLLKTGSKPEVPLYTWSDRREADKCTPPLKSSLIETVEQRAQNKRRRTYEKSVPGGKSLSVFTRMGMSPDVGYEESSK